MKSEKIVWGMIVLLVIAFGVMGNEVLKMKKETSAAVKKSQRATDCMEIQNTIAKHSYYYAAQEQWLELETVWAKKRDDISYGHNHGYYLGRKSVENYYGKKNETRRKQTLEMVSKLYPEVENKEENLGVGDLVMHTLTTPDIEIAEDGQTAQGVWMSIGLASRVGQDGKSQYNCFWEKFGVDFVKEDGQWKIWHFQIYSDVMYALPESMVGSVQGLPASSGTGGAVQAGSAGTVQAGAPQSGTQPQGAAGGMQSDMDKILEMYKTYSPTTVPELTPAMPKPYKTWEDTTPYIK